MTISVCVFCGSRHGLDPRFRALARDFGRLAGQAGVTLIYGGGHVGLMGAAADAALAAGGRVVGLIPARLLEREVGHRTISELIVTRDMFERKQQMIERADAFVVLPGGLGTLDELLEVITLRQLGYHDKPILIVDCDGYWDPFVAMVERVVAQAFAEPDVRALFEVTAGVEDTLARLGITTAPSLRAAGAD
jgi:uncharacterized protein (TIGR00730 family)